MNELVSELLSLLGQHWIKFATTVISGIIVLLIRHFFFNSAPNIKTFEKYVDKSSWSNELINNKEVWVCDKDNTFQIRINRDSEPFTEKWIRRFSPSVDKDGSEKHEVLLSVNGNKIKSYYFVIFDSGRIIVPLAKLASNGTRYWERNSLDFKIAKIIGSFGFYKTIEKVAEWGKIEIR